MNLFFFFFFNGMNILSFPLLLPFAEQPKPCVAWQPSEPVCLPGEPITAWPALCVGHWSAVTKQHLGHHRFISLRKSFQKARTQPVLMKRSHCWGAAGRVCSHTWQKRWWWRRRSHWKRSAEWCPWYPPTVQGKCLLCKHTPGRFPFKQ